MKRRDSMGDDAWAQQTRDALAAALAAVQDPAQMAALLEDLCTPAELEALADRWSVVPLLADGVPYRTIHERTGVSVTTVGRVARCLEHGSGGYRAALAAVGHPPGTRHTAPVSRHTGEPVGSLD